jgi:hypothetical protein
MKFKDCFAPALAFLLCCTVLPVASAHGATLVKDGKAVAVVALPPEPNDAEKLAASELIDHVQKMSGAKLETVTVDPKDLDSVLEEARGSRKAVVCLGRVALPRLEKAIAAKGKFRGTFALHVTPDYVLASGAGGDAGTHFAISELLEQQGVRWFMPGDPGTVIPKLDTIEVKEQETAQAPSFASRWFQMPDKDWQVRLRCGGKIFPSAHGLPGVPPFKEKPELYSLIKGERVRSQHCLSNPELLKYVVAAVKEHRAKGHGPAVGVGPNDGAGFCECENCRALDAGDYDPFSAEPSVTDRYIWFFNKVLEGVSDEYPDTKLAFYIYHSYMRPPVKVKPDKRIMGALAPITLDRVHGFSNPLSPEKSYAKWLLQEWSKLIPEVTDRGYWSNLADPGFNFVIVHRLRDEIPVSKDLGLYGWRVETFPNYGPYFPSMYVAGKLMWDHTADVDAILADVYEKFFGPAAEPMGKYVTLMDTTLRDTPYMTGCAWDMPHFYPADLRRQARSLLEEGAQLAAARAPRPGRRLGRRVGHAGRFARHPRRHRARPARARRGDRDRRGLDDRHRPGRQERARARGRAERSRADAAALPGLRRVGHGRRLHRGARLRRPVDALRQDRGPGAHHARGHAGRRADGHGGRPAPRRRA